MRMLWKHTTRVGTFFICQCPDGLFHPIFKDESYGGYSTPDQAAEDLANGCTFTISTTFDVTRLGIPESVADWQPVEQAH